MAQQPCECDPSRRKPRLAGPFVHAKSLLSQVSDCLGGLAGCRHRTCHDRVFLGERVSRLNCQELQGSIAGNCHFSAATCHRRFCRERPLPLQAKEQRIAELLADLQGPHVSAGTLREHEGVILEIIQDMNAAT